MKEVIQILKGCTLLFSSIIITAQTTEKKLFQSLLMFGHDIFLPLFGNAFESSFVQKITKRNSFIPVVMYEFTINSRFWFGLKAGHQTYSETMQRSTNVAAPGELHEFYSNESILGGNVYGKYILGQDKILQPYVGGGFGYQMIRLKEVNHFASGSEITSIRKYGEFAFLFKGGIMYSIGKILLLFSEVEYKPIPAVWVAGLVFRFYEFSKRNKGYNTINKIAHN